MAKRKYKPLDGRITAEIGKQRKYDFKSVLMRMQKTFRDWLIEKIDEFMEENRNEFN